MKIKKIDEGVYLRKGKGGYNLIYPIKKEISKPLKKGNIDWKNVFGIRDKGSWIIFFLLLILLFSVWAYYHDVELYRDVAQHPWDYYYFCYEPLDSDARPWLDLNWTPPDKIIGGSNP